MNISLTPILEQYLKQKVESGMYNSTSEVVREALRLLEDQDAMKSVKLNSLRQDIQLGIDSLDNGRSKKFDIESIIAKAKLEWEKQ
jgi:antitoxin ParD1/3/4